MKSIIILCFMTLFIMDIVNATGYDINLNQTISPSPSSLSSPTLKTVCNIDIDLEVNKTYVNTTGVCNITIRSKSGYCPMCPLPPNITQFVGEITPLEDNISWYQNSSDYCNISLLIKQCPMCRMNIPENYTLISNEQYRTLNESIRCWVDKFSTESQLDELRSKTCLVDDKMLLDGMNDLSGFERSIITDFARLPVGSYVTPLQFLDIARPNVTGSERAQLEYYTDVAFGRFVDFGFAEKSCQQIYNPMYFTNVTYCVFKPIINDYCLNKTASLTALKDESFKSGMWITFIIIVILVILWFIAMVLSSRASILPFR